MSFVSWLPPGKSRSSLGAPGDEQYQYMTTGFGLGGDENRGADQDADADGDAR
jgi:hypothetical protein